MVQTVSGVNKNMWRRRRSGLYVPNDMNFSTRGLVLFAPLWHPQLSVSPFNAWDIANVGVHSCTVVGALWGTTGRDFDGSDDNIACGKASSLDISDTITVEAWVYAGTFGDNEGIVAKGTVSGYWNLCSYSGSQFRFIVRDGVGFARVIVIGVADTWTHLVGVVDGRTATSMKIYSDGALAQEGDITAIGSLVDNTKDLLVGEDKRNTAFFDGLIGEVRVYNRALSLLEIIRNRNGTKWRYV